MANSEQINPQAVSNSDRLPGYARFAIGGAGGLLPVLALLVSVDIAAMSNAIENHLLTVGVCCGWGIRTAALFILGGAMALLNTDVVKPMSLVQIGVAAPALVASYASGSVLVNAADTLAPRPAVTTPGSASTIENLFISSALAADGTHRPEIVVAGGFFGDVVTGMTPGFGGKANVQRKAPADSSVDVSIIRVDDGTCKTMRSSAGALGQLEAQYPRPQYRILLGSCVPGSGN